MMMMMMIWTINYISFLVFCVLCFVCWDQTWTATVLFLCSKDFEFFCKYVHAVLIVRVILRTQTNIITSVHHNNDYTFQHHHHDNNNRPVYYHSFNSEQTNTNKQTNKQKIKKQTNKQTNTNKTKKTWQYIIIYQWNKFSWLE